VPAAVEVASADARPAKAKPGKHSAPAPAPAAPATEATSVAAAPAAQPSLIGGVAEGGQSLVKSLFKPKAETPAAVQVLEPDTPTPADVPTPPRRAASANGNLRVAALPETAKDNDAH
jgi:hypothetical protein